MELSGKPDWLKLRIPSGKEYVKVKHTLRSLGLHTVCEEARCPNLSECWGAGTATIMVMGETCSRRCGFCSVTSGKPGMLDLREPENVAIAIKEWGLGYVVITAVCRDDLDDGGATHFAKTIKAIREKSSQTVVEALIPDFHGNQNSIAEVVRASPRVICHNIETVARLSPKVRDFRASYAMSLQVLQRVKELDPSIYTKSSLMLGLGETEEELVETMMDLRSTKVSILTIGQYLQSGSRNLPVIEYVSPEDFNRLAEIASKIGFSHVTSGPLVRSSYKAWESFGSINMGKYVNGDFTK